MKKPKLRMNAWSIVSEAVEVGISWGLYRAHEHSTQELNDDERERLTEHLEREIMNALSEVVDWERSG